MKSLGGQPVVILDSVLFFHLREGPWLTAPEYFGWVEKSPGIGVNAEVINHALGNGLRIAIIDRSSLIRLLIRREINDAVEINNKEAVTNDQRN